MSTPGSRKVVVDIVGDAKGYKKATDEAVKASTGFSGKMEALDRKLEAMGKRGGVTGAILGGVGVGAGLGAFSLIERGIGSVVGAMGDAVQSAIEDERATAKLTQTLQANVRAWDGQLDAVNAAIDAGAQLAFTDDDVRDGLNALIPRTHDLTEAIKLNRLAMDLARAKNMDLGEAAGLVGKAYSGQASALRRAGIAIKNTKDSTKALAELQAAVSGQAETYGSTTEGAMKRADIAGSEAMESLGYAIKPLVSGLASLAASVIPQVVSSIGLFGEAMHNLQRIADPTLAGAEDLNYAIIAQASAYGVGADKVIAYKDAILAARKAEADRTELVGRMQAQFAEADDYFQRAAKSFGTTADEAKNRFIEGQIKRLDALAKSIGMTTSELLLQAPLLLTTGDNVKSYLDKVQALTDGLSELDAEAEKIPPTLAEQGLEFVRLYAASEKAAAAGAIVKGAFEDMFAGARKAKPEITKPAIWTQQTVDRMQGTLRDALDPYRNAWKQLAEWAKDPFRPKVFAEKIKEYHDEALKRARQAAKDGKPKVAERWREVAIAMENPIAIAAINIGLSVEDALAAIALVEKTKGTLQRIKDILTQIGDDKPGKPPKQPGTGGRRSGRVEYRAGGGPVEKDRPYIVGEVGKELFVPERDGTIIPTHQLSGNRGGGSWGGGGIVQHITVHVHAPVGADLSRAGQQVVTAIQAYQRNGGAAHVKRAVNG